MVNIKKAANLTLDLLVSVERSYRVQHSEESVGMEHVMRMLTDIINGSISGEKAHRWLGWAQACIVIFTETSLDDMKRANQKAQ